MQVGRRVPIHKLARASWKREGGGHDGSSAARLKFIHSRWVRNEHEEHEVDVASLQVIGIIKMKSSATGTNEQDQYLIL